MQESIYNDSYDAAAVLMQRGEFLRRLREMERQDEEERARELVDGIMEMENMDDFSVLDYENYLRNQGFYDDYKHVNYRNIDFGFVGDRRLMIQQSREFGKGGLVWDAGYILADHLIQKRDAWNASGRPLRIVELGAGTGVTGLMMACAFPESTVHLSDLKTLLPLLEENAKGHENATVGEIEWGTYSTLEKYDVIVGSDVVASIYDSSGLAKTIHDLSTSRTQIYLACRDRLAGSIEQFEGHLRRLFTTVERKKANSRNRNPDVWVLHANGKRTSQ